MCFVLSDAERRAQRYAKFAKLVPLAVKKIIRALANIPLLSDEFAAGECAEKVCALVDETDKKEIGSQFARIERYETIADNMEIEIARYLEFVANEHLSDETKDKIRVMLKKYFPAVPDKYPLAGILCFRAGQRVADSAVPDVALDAPDGCGIGQ